jgi:hypothetical protein
MATGLSISSTSNLSSGQKILVEAAMDAFEPAAPNPDLIWNVRIPAGVKQWDLLTYARLANAASLTEGVDLSSVQQLVANSLSVTPAENGILVTLSKRLIRRQGDRDVISGAGTMIANSLRRLMDVDVISLYDGFSKETPGTGAALDVIHFFGAVAYLLTDNDSSYGPAPLPLRAALHIEQISDIVDQLTDKGLTDRPQAGITERVLQNWWKGSDRLYGVQIFHAGNIPRASNNDAKGGLFSQQALALVMANEMEITEDEDPSLRAIEYGAFQEWATGERADTHGVEIFSEAGTTLT